MRVIGQKLRALRLEKNLSLRELAAKAEVSVSLLSQIENGKSMPSVRSLHSIADVLAVPLGYFFPEDESGLSENGHLESGQADVETAPLKEQVLRFDHRPRLELNNGIIWTRLTPHEDQDAQFLELYYETGASSGAKMSHHRGRELGLVLSGELTIEIGVEKYVLHEGDSIMYDSTHPHRLTNTGSVPMKAIWVVMTYCDGHP
jgi:transcriptional regulator with XRE-family HTH domain